MGPGEGMGMHQGNNGVLARRGCKYWIERDHYQGYWGDFVRVVRPALGEEACFEGGLFFLYGCCPTEINGVGGIAITLGLTFQNLNLL